MSLDVTDVRAFEPATQLGVSQPWGANRPPASPPASPPILSGAPNDQPPLGSPDPLNLLLLWMLAACVRSELICAILGIDRSGLETRARTLDVPELPAEQTTKRRSGGRWRPWETDELRALISHWLAGARVGDIAEALDRSKGAIYRRKRLLGLPGRVRKELLEAGGLDPAYAWPPKISPGILKPDGGRPAPSKKREAEEGERRGAEGCDSATARGATSGVLEADDIVGASERLEALWKRMRNGVEPDWTGTRIDKSEALELAVRVLAGQSRDQIMVEMGLKRSTVVCRAARMDLSLPGTGGQSLDVNRAFERLEETGLVPRTCRHFGRLFFAQKSDSQAYCGEYRRQAGLNKGRTRRAKKGVGEKARESQDREMENGEMSGESRSSRAAKRRRQESEEWKKEVSERTARIRNQVGAVIDDMFAELDEFWRAEAEAEAEAEAQAERERANQIAAE